MSVKNISPDRQENPAMRFLQNTVNILKTRVKLLQQQVVSLQNEVRALREQTGKLVARAGRSINTIKYDEFDSEVYLDSPLTADAEMIFPRNASGSFWDMKFRDAPPADEFGFAFHPIDGRRHIPEKVFSDIQEADGAVRPTMTIDTALHFQRLDSARRLPQPRDYSLLNQLDPCILPDNCRVPPLGEIPPELLSEIITDDDYKRNQENGLIFEIQHHGV